MRFFEIFEPYYALIKAKNEDEAAQRYIDEVAGEENELEEIREAMREVSEEEARKELIGTDNFYGKPITSEEINRAINENITEVLLIDSGLL